MPRILLIDDDPMFLKMYRINLAFYKGVETIAAASGQEGIVEAERSHPDIIFLDFHMPGMNGAEVGRLLRANPRTAKIPIVLVSSASDDTDTPRAVYDLKMTKPITNAKLQPVLEKLLGLKSLGKPNG